MNKLLILEGTTTSIFSQAMQIEGLYPEGEWLHFNLINAERSQALYKINEEGFKDENFISLEAHSEFMNYFLGLFTPDIDEHVNLVQRTNFTDFCKELNRLLSDEVTVLDLSREKFWILVQSPDPGASLKVPEKLRNYLNFV